ILATSFYQLFVKSKQQDLQADSFQVLKYQAPQAALIVFILTPFLDDMNALHDFLYLEKNDEMTEFLYYYPMSNRNAALVVLFISSCLAFFVNLSIFLVVSRTNPIT